jgi:hypothetical protein
MNWLFLTFTLLDGQIALPSSLLIIMICRQKDLASNLDLYWFLEVIRNL